MAKAPIPNPVRRPWWKLVPSKSSTPLARSIPPTRATSEGDLVAANNLSDVSSPATAFGNIKQAATTTVTGVVELATDGENAANVAVQGNDSRMSDARTPTAHVHSGADITSGTVAPARLGSGSGGATKFLREDSTFQTIAGVGDLLSTNNLSDVASAATAFGNIKQAATTTTTGAVELATSGENAANVVVQGNDARLSDARTPLAHTHAQADVTNLVTDLAGKAALVHTHAAADITSGTLDQARLGSGGGGATKFLREDSTWQTVSGGSAVPPDFANITLPSRPSYGGSFTVTIATSTVGDLVEAFESAEDTQAGELPDRFEFGHMVMSGIVTASTTATIRYTAVGGPVSGSRRIAYRITAL